MFKKLDTAAISNACMACHKDADRTHWSGSSHDRANVSCLSCHSLHNAKGHGDLVAKNTSETCYVCHKDVKAQMRRSAHMPVEEGKMDCNSCHSPHGTSTPKLLNASNTNQLCYQCHQDKRGPHLWEHQPVRENCLELPPPPRLPSRKNAGTAKRASCASGAIPIQGIRAPCMMRRTSQVSGAKFLGSRVTLVTQVSTGRITRPAKPWLDKEEMPL
jgi:predicted CXXCH cytochrome family protein